MLPRKDFDRVERLIERRLTETLVAAGGVRAVDPARPMRTAAGTGLFLVKRGVTGAAQETDSRAAQQQQLRGAEERADSKLARKNRRRPSRIVAVGRAHEQTRHERLLASMAGLAPLLWFGHAALVWLKVV